MHLVGNLTLLSVFWKWMSLLFFFRCLLNAFKLSGRNRWSGDWLDSSDLTNFILNFFCLWFYLFVRHYHIHLFCF